MSSLELRTVVLYLPRYEQDLFIPRLSDGQILHRPIQLRWQADPANTMGERRDQGFRMVRR